jgi:hypothetical protein
MTLAALFSFGIVPDVVVPGAVLYCSGLCSLLEVAVRTALCFGVFAGIGLIAVE